MTMLTQYVLWLPKQMERTLQWTVNKDPVPHNSETSTAAANAPTDLFISENEVTLDEVRNAVKSLKNDRAAGICNITAELLKFGGECRLRWLQVIINCVWISETIPDDWWRGIILPFWKHKGNRLTCANHRDITLLSIPGKLLALILLRRSVSAINKITKTDIASWLHARALNHWPDLCPPTNYREMQWT